ncbi:hypothetical protein SLNSH_00640 [Alsobacter soli]|uniref:DUF1638 domain-containing protein n=1 Tax=Alsobacter soli TaxID=2109933 RepID=A0A2T1HZ12_9HYPH|nr:DUF1638 domain-containing protein [Alsobacter soli]PSC06927.1 hypothetical protein SLNSH_00640 [Alsobacter soli]
MTDVNTAPAPPRTLVIACGALARELLAVIEANRLTHLAVTCLPGILHNRPEKIPGEVRRKIRANRDRYDEILCLYGDCGTGGLLDEVLREEGVARIEGTHCYEFFMGGPDFAALADAEPATFYLTDYLVRHFERLMIKGLGLDRFPELLPMYFGNYKRVVYLAQIEDPALDAKARRAAERLGLAYEKRVTGLGGIEEFLERAAAKQS